MYMYLLEQTQTVLYIYIYSSVIGCSIDCTNVDKMQYIVEIFDTFNFYCVKKSL